MKFNANDHQAFFNDLSENGFHIFSRQHAENQGYYPNPFPPHPAIRIGDVQENDIITIRAFFSTSKKTMAPIDSGHIDLEIEWVDRDAESIFGNILTELPQAFALAKGTTIELGIDEVLSVQGR